MFKVERTSGKVEGYYITHYVLEDLNRFSDMMATICEKCGIRLEEL